MFHLVPPFPPPLSDCEYDCRGEVVRKLVFSIIMMATGGPMKGKMEKKGSREPYGINITVSVLDIMLRFWY